MAKITYTDFSDNYLVKDGQFGNAANLNKAPNQLKIEIDENTALLEEHSTLLDVLQGINPDAWAIGIYNEGDFVSHNDAVWKSLEDNNSEEPGTGEKWAQVQLSVSGGSGAGAAQIAYRRDFTATEGQVDFFFGINMTSIKVYVDGILLAEDEYTFDENNVTLLEPLNEGTLVTIIYSDTLPFDPAIMVSNIEETATAGQTSITVDYIVNYVDVFVNGLKLSTSDFTATDGSTITFSSALNAGDVISVKSVTTLAELTGSFYTSTEVDTLLATKADDADVYTKSETLVLLDEKADTTYVDGEIAGLGATVATKADTTYVDSEIANIDLSSKQDTLVSGTNIKTINSESILGSGDLALDTSADAIGVGQTWQDVTASRSAGVTYTNTTGKPIIVSVYTNGGNDTSASLLVDGLAVSTYVNSSGSAVYFTPTAIIPVGSTYSLSASQAINYWRELR